ncbi:MAG TPA: universal stress protein [Chloroflexota bacterium]|nr:universal stress protein [Chloroflexota bacterium]
MAPLDESDQSQRALVYALDLAAATGGQIKLVRASGVEAEAGVDSLARHARDLQDAGFAAVEWSVVEGVDAVTAILDAARAWHPDIIAMATTKRNAIDRWLNDSVTDAVVRAAPAPVLVVPPDWTRPPPAAGRSGRVLVPLDGSPLAERALGSAVRLSALMRVELVLLRAVDAGDLRSDSAEVAVRGARAYLRRTAARVRSALPGQRVSTRTAVGAASAAIARAALEDDVDAIVMSTHGRGGLARAVLGSTATAALEQATVPLILLGPGTLAGSTPASIRVRAPVRTGDSHHVGEVHRIVLDLDQRAVVGVVVLGRGPLARDILVPIDFVGRLDEDAVVLRLTSRELDQLPDFAYDQYLTPPPTWTAFAPFPTGPVYVPVVQRKHLGPTQHDVTPGARVLGSDGEIGRVERVELDPATAEMTAVWVRPGGDPAHELRVPAEWLGWDDDHASLRVQAARAEVEAYLGRQGRSFTRIG